MPKFNPQSLVMNEGSAGGQVVTDAGRKWIEFGGYTFEQCN